MAAQSNVNGIKTWTANGSVQRNKNQFNLGTRQNATMTGSSSSATDVLTYEFSVHQ